MGIPNNLKNKAYRAFAEQRWNDVIELIDPEYYRDPEIQSLLCAAKDNLSHKISDRVGIANALFFDPHAQRGLCLAVGLRRSPGTLCSDDYIVANKNAKISVQKLLQIMPTHGTNSDLVLPIVEWPATYEGSSIGLAAAIVILSVSLRKEIPGDVAFSAAINADGALLPVRNIEEKCGSLLSNRPQITRLFVSGQQKYHCSGVQLAYCHSLFEAAAVLWGNDFAKSRAIPLRSTEKRSLFAALNHYKRMQDARAVDIILTELEASLAGSTSPTDLTFYAYVLAEQGLQLSHQGKGTEVSNLMKKAINQIKNLGSDVNSEIPFYDIYVKYGMWLMDQYEFDYAEQNFNEAMKEIEDRRLPNYQRIGIWNSLGQLYSKKGDYTGAKTYFELSFYEAKRTGEYNDWSRLFCYMADNAMNHDHFSEADQYLSQAFEYCSPDKPTQKFFNLFWQACLYFYMNNYKSFLAVFNELEGEVCSYGSETHGPHWGYLYAMAAGVFHITGMTAACQSYKSRSKSLLKGTNNLQMMLLPIKIDAWLLANSACNETVFHNLKELKRLLKTYSLNNVYFKETAQKISKATCSDEPVWRVLFYKIRF